MRTFAANLEKAFYGFEPDFFQHNLTRIVDDAIAVIKSTLEFGLRLSRSATSRTSARPALRRSSQFKPLPVDVAPASDVSDSNPPALGRSL